MFDPSGRRVLITGASSGLGAALAMGLAEQGAVIGLAARRPDRLDAVLAEALAVQLVEAEQRRVLLGRLLQYDLRVEVFLREPVEE